VIVEHFTAAGSQRLGCGHVVDKGGALVDVSFVDDDVVRAVFSLCPECWAALGRLGLER
jgi:hypothetical protein